MLTDSSCWSFIVCLHQRILRPTIPTFLTISYVELKIDPSEAAALTDYLSTGTYPKTFSKDEKRRMREKASSFTVVDRTLYHLGRNAKKQKVIIGQEEASKIMQELHCNIVGGCHFGQNATIVKVTDRFWWRSVTSDVRTFCQQCSVCQTANPNNKPQVATLHPVPVKDLFHRFGVDLVGPLKETPRGNRYAIVATEYLTRWVEVAAIPDKSATTIHHFLMGLTYRYGACEVLLHDQGREFCNTLVRDLCAAQRTDQATTSAYHPQSNGLTERFNQTLVTQLMKLSNKDADDWDQYLQPIAFSYRTNIQASTKMSPFELLYGQKARLPIDLELDTTNATVTDVPKEPPQSSLDARQEHLQTDVSSSRQQARANIEKAQAQQKVRYDLKHSGTFFKVGDKVSRFNRRRETRMGDKLAPRYHGPFIISEVLGKGVYRLEKNGKVQKSKVNGCNLKRWNEPEKKTTLHYTEEDLQDVSEGRWINDRIIDAASQLISESTEFVTQSTLLLQTSFKEVPKEKTTIQFLHDRDHWMTVTNDGDKILVADSISRHHSDHATRQMRELFPCSASIERVRCPKQTNGSDCGIFAIANGFELANGATLKDVQYDVPQMRPHLLRCLREKMILPFPKNTASSRVTRSKKIA